MSTWPQGQDWQNMGPMNLVISFPSIELYTRGPCCGIASDWTGSFIFSRAALEASSSRLSRMEVNSSKNEPVLGLLHSWHHPVEASASRQKLEFEIPQSHSYLQKAQVGSPAGLTFPTLSFANARSFRPGFGGLELLRFPWPR